jgi:hypothetical protein
VEFDPRAFAHDLEAMHRAIMLFIMGYDRHVGYTFVAHNAGGYDLYILMGWFLRSGEKPTTCIRTGQRIKLLRIGGENERKGVTFIDSLCFLAMSLDSLGKSFNLPVSKDF